MLQSVSVLKGRVVLLVEDESLVSMLAEDILRDAGCEVLLAMRLDEALRIAKDAEFHLAVLDVNLGQGESSYPVAEVLAERGIPFVLATGYDRSGLDGRFDGCPWLQKPYSPPRLLAQLASLASGPNG